MGRVGTGSDVEEPVPEDLGGVAQPSCRGHPATAEVPLWNVPKGTSNPTSIAPIPGGNERDAETGPARGDVTLPHLLCIIPRDA